MINAAVAKALYETQLETLENFKKYLAEKDDVDMEFMEELIGGFKATLQAPKVPAAGKGKGKSKKADAEDTSENTEKKKRAPSAYTMYIQYEMQHLKKDYPEIKSGKELMAKAVEAWGELTEENKSELKKMLKENPSLTSEQLVTRVLGGAKTETKVVAESDAESEAPAEEAEATESETEKKSPLRPGFGGAANKTKKAGGNKKAGKQ